MRAIVGAALVVAVLLAGLAPCPPPETASPSGAAELVPLCWCHLGDAPATSTIAGVWLAIPSGVTSPLATLPGLPGESPPARLPSPPPEPSAPIPISA